MLEGGSGWSHRTDAAVVSHPAGGSLRIARDGTFAVATVISCRIGGIVVVVVVVVVVVDGAALAVSSPLDRQATKPTTNAISATTLVIRTTRRCLDRDSTASSEPGSDPAGPSSSYASVSSAGPPSPESGRDSSPSSNPVPPGGMVSSSLTL